MQNKYRLSTRAYRDAQTKKRILLELQSALSYTRKNNIQFNHTTENHIDMLYNSIDEEIKECEQVPEFDNNEEVYRYHQMTFKKVYDNSINPDDSCKHCDIKCPCRTWNSEIGCLKHKSANGQYMINNDLSEEDKERLCIKFDGVFKNLTPEENERY